MYTYKSPPFAHQRQVFELSAEREYFALLMEQGTGKSKVVVDTAAYLYESHKINCLIVAAPNGVHRKWLLEDIPFSLPDHINYRAAVWQSSNARARKAYTALFEPGQYLRIFLINIEALSTKGGEQLVKELLRAYTPLFGIDESSRIKNPGSQRTDAAVGLGEYADYRRICNGLPVANSPFELFSQFQFLHPEILGRSYYAFKTQYAEFYPPNHPFVQNILKKNPKVQQALAQNPQANLRRWTPQIVMLDEVTGQPKYKNLERLKAKIAPHSFRVTKDECFDLPPKVYSTRYFTLEKEQRKLYDSFYEDSRGILEDELVIIQHKLVVYLRLHQIACGYLPVDGVERPLFSSEDQNPRVKCLMEELEEYDKQTIIWCRFKREVRIISAMLGPKAVSFYGDTEDREANKAAFTQGHAQYLVGTAAFGGIGHNFAFAPKGIFNSNTFDYDQRAQAEDRQHRWGIAEGQESVLYVDIQAEDTIDQDLVASLRMKKSLGDYMMMKRSSLETT